MVTFDHVSGTSELVQFAILTAAGRDRDQQQRSAVPFDAN
jgi:hypothetical protein